MGRRLSRIEMTTLINWMFERYEIIEWSDDRKVQGKVCKPKGEHIKEEVIMMEAVAAGVFPEEATLATYKSIRQDTVGHMHKAPPRKPMMDRVDELEAKVAELEARVDAGHKKLEELSAQDRSDVRDLLGRPFGTPNGA